MKTKLHLKLLVLLLTVLIVDSTLAQDKSRQNGYVVSTSLQPTLRENTLEENPKLNAWSETDKIVDEEFWISRVPLQARVTNTATEIRNDYQNGKKLNWWMPAGGSGGRRGLPYYIYDDENFNMWQYIDTHGNWSSGLFLVPGALTDQAHRHGVKIMSNLFVNWNVPYSQGGTNNASRSIDGLLKKDSNGDFKYTAKIISILKYYGVDGLSLNIECSNMGSARADEFQTFLAELYDEAALQNHDTFEVVWYDAQSNTGGLSFMKQLSSGNQDWFQKADKKISSQFMLDYTVTDFGANSGATRASLLNRDPFDVYGTVHVSTRFNQNNIWNTMRDQQISLGLWGEHQTNNFWATSSKDTNGLKQGGYLKSLERFFSGGNQNPSDLPTITHTATRSTSGLASFHGMARYFSAKSTINSLPFTSRFNLGLGQFFNVDGKTTYPYDWNNIGIQDFVPSWRWWITGNKNIEAAFTFEDAWHAGSCLKLSGAASTTATDIRLYKTDLTLSGSPKAKVTFKLPGATIGSASKLRLALAFSGNPSTLEYFDLGNTVKEGWNTIEVDLGSKSGQTIVMTGLSVQGASQSDYVALIGELAITNGNVPVPAAPISLEIENKLETFNKADIKMKWTLPGNPRYNDDTWYFDIYKQNNDGSNEVIGRSASRAHYILDIPLDPNKADIVIGVAAVAYDGVTRSPITWSQSLPKSPQPTADISVNHHSIPVGGTANLTALDASATNIDWVVQKNDGSSTPLTANGSEFTVTLNDAGTYEVEVTVTNLNGTIAETYIDYLQVLPENTGSSIDFTADNLTVEVNQDVNFAITGMTANASQGVNLDNARFTVPQDVLNVATNKNFSIGFWYKMESLPAEKFDLVEKFTKWWGPWNLQMTPEGKIEFFSANLRDELLSNTPLNLWNQITLTYDGTTLKFYFNGVERFSKARSISLNHDTANTDTGYSFLNYKDTYLDDVQFWDKTLSPTEVSTYMNGIPGATPAGLTGYWDFESSSTSTVTPTHGTLNGSILGTLNYTGGAPLLEGQGLAYEYSWDFEEGESSSNSAATPSVSYNTAGTYDVSLRISGGGLVTEKNKSAYITVTNGTVPDAPTNLSASVSGSDIVLNWTDNSNNETGFTVLRSTTLGGSYTVLATTGSNAISYADDTALADITYYYVVKAITSSLESTISNEASAVTTAPTVPSNLTATISGSDVVLNWTDNSADETGFIVQRSTVLGGSYTNITTVAVNTINYTDDTALASTTYYYVVKAITGSLESDISNEASVTTDAATDQYISIGSVSVADVNTLDATGAFTIETWINLNDATRWKGIFRKQNISTDRIALATGNNNSLSVIVSNGTNTYGTTANDVLIENQWQHIAMVYEGSANSNANKLKLYIDGVLQTLTFSGAIPSSTSSNAASLDFMKDLDNSIDEIRVWNTTLSSTTINAWKDNQLSSCHPNFGALQVYLPLDGDTNGALGTNINGTISSGTYLNGGQSTGDYGCSSSVPFAPSSLATQVTSSSVISLSWSDNSSDETSFNIERKEGAGSFTEIATLGADITSYNDTALTASTVYTYRVKANNHIGDSSYSNEANATTLSETDYHIDLTASNINAGNVTELNATSIFTMESWVRFDNISSWNTILSKISNSTNRIVLQTGTNNNLYAIIANGSNSYGYSANNIITTGQWYHLAVVYDGTKSGNTERLKMYLDGVQLSLSFNGTIPTTTNTNSSDFKASATLLDGQLDEVRIWSAALTNSSLSTWKNKVLGTCHTDISSLVLYWKFNEGSGSTATVSGLGDTYTGTILSGATYEIGDPVTADSGCISAKVSKQKIGQGLKNEGLVQRLYPNPVLKGTTLNIDLTSKSDLGKVNISITNLSGLVVMRYDADIHKGLNNLKLTIGQWQSGLYFITLQGDKMKEVKKLLVK